MIQGEGVTDMDDERRLVTFYSRSVYMAAKSEKEGRPIYEDVDYLMINLPSDQKTVIDRPLTEKDKAIWPRWWQLYQQGKSGVVNGTPLEDMPFLPRSRAMELRGLQIFTVEQLRDIPEQDLLKYGPDTAMLQDHAKKMLDPATNMEVRLREDNATLRQEVAELKSRIEQLAHLPKSPDEEEGEEEAASAPPKRRAVKRKPGRPRKRAVAQPRTTEEARRRAAKDDRGGAEGRSP